MQCLSNVSFSIFIPCHKYLLSFPFLPNVTRHLLWLCLLNTKDSTRLEIFDWGYNLLPLKVLLLNKFSYCSIWFLTPLLYLTPKGNFKNSLIETYCHLDKNYCTYFFLRQWTMYCHGNCGPPQCANSILVWKKVIGASVSLRQAICECYSVWKFLLRQFLARRPLLCNHSTSGVPLLSSTRSFQWANGISEQPKVIRRHCLAMKHRIIKVGKDH